MTTETSAINFQTPSGLSVTLSPDEYRLALLWLVDFEGAWEGLEAATAFVIDGEAKLALIRRLYVQPLTDDLASLGQHVEPLAMLAARHWFRQGMTSAQRSSEAAT